MRKKSLYLELSILLIITLIITFYKFPAIPKFLAFDEVEFTKLALSLDGKPYEVFSNLATGHSTLYFYVLLLSLKSIGINIFALRLPAAIFGILSVLVFYFIIFRVFKQSNIKISKFFPFTLTFIFLTSRWFIDFSRFAFEPTFLLFLELMSVFFLLNETNLSFFFSGLFAGLAYNSYTPGRIFFILPLIFMILKFVKPLLTRKQLSKAIIIKLFLFIIPFIIVITPLTIYLSNTKESRIDQLFFWRNHEMTFNQKVNGTVQNISNISLMFFVKGDMNGKHNYPGKPALNPILAGLFLIGLFYALKNIKNLYNQIFLGYLILSIIPSLPIYPWENPSMLRTFTTIPSVVYFAGIAILNIGKKIKPKYYIFIAVFIFISSVYELRTYFKYQVPVFEHSFEIQYPLERAIKMKNPYEKIK